MGRTDSPKSAKQPVKRWYLYIVKCRDGTLYTGITNDLCRRMEQHNDGKASKYTRTRVPVKLIYKEACLNKSSALKKELRIKDLSRQAKVEYVLRKSLSEPRRRQGRKGKQTRKKAVSRKAAETQRKALSLAVNP